MSTINNCGRRTSLRFDRTQSSEAYPPNVGQGPWCNFSVQMIVIQFERYPELCWHTTHQRGSTGERSVSYISGLLSQELWWLFIKSTQQGTETCSKIWIPSSSCRRLPVGELKEGLASRILWKVWDIWLPSSIYMTPDSNYWKPHPLWRSQKPLLSLCPQTQLACA